MFYKFFAFLTLGAGEYYYGLDKRIEIDYFYNLLFYFDGDL